MYLKILRKSEENVGKILKKFHSNKNFENFLGYFQRVLRKFGNQLIFTLREGKLQSQKNTE